MKTLIVSSISLLFVLALAAAPVPDTPHVFPLEPAPAVYISDQALEPAIKTADNCYFDENGDTVCDPPDPIDPCLANPDACQ